MVFINFLNPGLCLLTMTPRQLELIEFVNQSGITLAPT
jgi:hypothetical protein